MYLHIGNEISIPLKKIIAILDLEAVDPVGPLREFLDTARGQQKIVTTTGNSVPKSCIITDDQLYLSNISTVTLARRAKKKGGPAYIE